MDERGKKYLIKEDREFQTDLGIIKKEQMERATIGDTIITHLNKEFKVPFLSKRILEPFLLALDLVPETEL